MKRMMKWLFWVAGIVAVLLAAVHFALSWGLNTPEIQRKVSDWVEHATGCRAGFARLDYGLFPPRLKVQGLQVAKEDAGASVDVRSDEAALAVSIRRKEVTSLEVKGPSVTWREGKRLETDGESGGKVAQKKTDKPAKTAEEVSAELDKALGKAWLSLKKVSVENGRFEWRDAEGATKLLLAGIGLEARDVAKDRPLDARVAFCLGSKANPATVEFHAGAPEAWMGRMGDWPLRVRVEARLEDLAAARAALGGADTKELKRPALCAECSGTPGGGLSLEGKFSDGAAEAEPDIVVTWKGTARFEGFPGASAWNEGAAAALDIEAPALRWGMVDAKGAKIQIAAAGSGGWNVRTTGRVDRVEGGAETGGVSARVLEALQLPMVTAWLPGLSERVSEVASGGLGIGDISFAAAWRGDAIEVEEARLGEGGYSLMAAGRVDLAARELDLRAELSATPEETARLAGGRSLEGWMPARKGCLVFPMSVEGPWNAPRFVPDTEAWERHIREQLAQPETQERIGREVERGLERLHSKDRRNVEAGLKLLNGFLQ